MLKELLGNYAPRVGLALTYLLLAGRAWSHQKNSDTGIRQTWFESGFYHLYQRIVGITHHTEVL